MKVLATIPLLHQPGESVEYGLSIDVLGYLVEVVSGMPLDQFFAERIFKPLGMTDTHFFIPEAKRERLATVYERTGGGPITRENPKNRLWQGSRGLFNGLSIERSKNLFLWWCRVSLYGF